MHSPLLGATGSDLARHTSPSPPVPGEENPKGTPFLLAESVLSSTRLTLPFEFLPPSKLTMGAVQDVWPVYSSLNDNSLLHLYLLLLQKKKKREK